MKTIQSNWYTACTLPNYEKKVNAELLKRGYESYLPVQTVHRRWSDRIKKLEVPLFPHYIFIKTTANGRRESAGITGLLKFITFEGKPAIISEDEIRAIQQLERHDPEVESELVEGSKVRIIRGPLAGLRGILFFKKRKNRFAVIIEGIQQTLAIEVNCSYLIEESN